MNRKLVFLILVVFCSGMLLGCVSASHTYHKGGYTFTVSDYQYNQIQKSKNGDHSVELGYHIKTKYTKNVKVPVYKNKKVTKYKWVQKKVLVWKSDNVWGDFKTYKLPSKYRSWKYVGDTSRSSANGQYSYGYHVFKKKVAYTGTKKVKTGTKTVKCPVYARIGVSSWQPWVDFCASKGSAYKVLNDYRRYPL